MPEPVVPKSVALSLAGAGVLAALVIHPYVGFVLWGLAVLVLVQELLFMVAWPLLWVWRQLLRRNQ